MPRAIVTALLFLLILVFAAASGWAQTPSSGYTPPLRGAPEGRVGGASRDITIGPSRVALVIGNSAYQHLPRLENPDNDAQLIAATLKSLGFELIGDGAQTDLDRAGFEKVIREFGAKLSGSEVGLFYYAGHGVQVDGANYLVPVAANPETKADLDFELVNADLVLKQMETAGSKLNLVILDACRNNPFGGKGLRDSGGGLAQMRAPEGTLISYATQPGNVAVDGANGHSPFTVALAEAMQQSGVPVLEAFNSVGVTVNKETGGKQQPWVNASPIEGNFYFVGPTTVNVTPSQPSASPSASTGTSSATTPATAEAEIVFWQSIVKSKNPDDFEDFIKRYPDSPFVSLAQRRLAALKETQTATVAPPPAQVAPAAVSPPVQPAPPTPPQTPPQEPALAGSPMPPPRLPMLGRGLRVIWDHDLSGAALIVSARGDNPNAGPSFTVCRSEFRGGIHPGRVIGDACHISWGGREYVLPTFEVGHETGGPGRWGPRGGFRPLIIGHEAGGKPLLLCRTVVGAEGMLPGKVVDGDCDVGFNGVEVVRHEFEVYYPN
jgi:uncharacterized caspase-like protein